MKKLLNLLVVLFAFSVVFAADETRRYASALDVFMKPIDVVTYTVYDVNVDTSMDTIATTEIHFHGPYPLAEASGTPMYKGFSLRTGAITGTSPTMAVAYQLTMKSGEADTIATNWTYFDTIAATGQEMYVDLTSKIGKFFWLRVDNYDTAEGQIPLNMYLEFKKNYTWSKFK